ncbi:hypothetical protein L6164_016514 [Bauhinia variegata]|uniref:Uncharacterized protein n=1 Tax=Bauhinia variegata TaxID=167791 RepID=A0ACB9NNW2_BAUVA|nr:hypothetical protein L6164_016514 [Bauhinia variegata]
MLPCKCLPSFSRRSSQDIGDYAYYPDPGEEGCVRKLEPCGENIAFLNLHNVKVRTPDEQLSVNNEAECESLCGGLCSGCQAFSNISSDIKGHSNLSSICWIWTKNLTMMEEHNLEHALTPRTCEPCCTNIIPYPLRTGLTCGDPMYSNFSCDKSTGNVSFRANGSNYPVIGIKPIERKFHIKTENILCNANTSGDASLLTHISYPFHVVLDECYGAKDLVVTWEPPLEPNCSNSTDCQGWPNSSCNASETGTRKCFCDTNYRWNSSILSCTFQDRESINRIQGRMFDSARQVKDLLDLEGLEEKDNEGIGVPYFDFESILRLQITSQIQTSSDEGVMGLSTRHGDYGQRISCWI